jgi:plastocyanin
MRKLLVAGLLVAFSATLLVAGPALSARKHVEVDDNYFVREGKPPTVNVRRNDTVVWEWEGSNPHNVSVTKGPVRFNRAPRVRADTPRSSLVAGPTGSSARSTPRACE